MLDFIAAVLPFDIIAFACIGISWLLTDILRRKLVEKNIMDTPNARSMHTTPVPRGGGIAVTGLITMGMLLFMSVAPFSDHAISVETTVPYAYLLVSITILSVISWADDKRGMSPAVRLAAHLTAALVGSFALPEGTVLFGDLLPLWLDRTAMIVGWAWFINLTNFMDGIDGITSMQMTLNALGASLLLAILYYFSYHLPLPKADMTLAAFIAGACIGFAIHNWHPAKIFLGDVGSVPLGFLVAFLLLRLVSEGHLIPALILPLYYLADSGITITRRALRGEKIWQAHKEHFYQRAAEGEGRHDIVVIKIADANFLLILMAGLGLYYPAPALLGAILIVAFLLKALHKSSQKGH